MSDFQFTNPVRKLDESEPADIVSDTIISTTMMASKSLKGTIVKRRTSGGRSGSRGRRDEGNSLNQLDSDDEDYITPA